MKLPPVYPILDAAVLADRNVPLIEAAHALLEAGAEILQFRYKGYLSRTFYESAKALNHLCRSAKVLFVINDRADLAVLLEAALHVGQDDLPPSDARRLVGPERVLGYSTHNERQLLAGAEEPVDYVALGPIFGTSSKINPDPAVGLEHLARLRPLTAKPLVAIGGITRETAHAVWSAGANSVAVVGDLYPRGCDSAAIRERMEEWMRLAANE